MMKRRTTGKEQLYLKKVFASIDKVFILGGRLGARL